MSHQAAALAAFTYISWIVDGLIAILLSVDSSIRKRRESSMKNYIIYNNLMNGTDLTWFISFKCPLWRFFSHTTHSLVVDACSLYFFLQHFESIISWVNSSHRRSASSSSSHIVRLGEEVYFTHYAADESESQFVKNKYFSIHFYSILIVWLETSYHQSDI